MISALKERFDPLLRRLDALSARERVLLFVVVFGGLYTLINNFLLTPLDAQVADLEKQIARKVQQGERMQKQIRTLNAGQKNSPLTRQARLDEQLKRNEEALLDLTSHLVKPDEMVDLVEKLIDENGGLELVSLENVPAMPIVTDPETGESEDNITLEGRKPLYKHGVQVQVKGKYFDLMAYIASLEAVKWDVFWAEADIQTIDYPVSELNLTIYTLSEDATWLQV